LTAYGLVSRGRDNDFYFLHRVLDPCSILSSRCRRSRAWSESVFFCQECVFIGPLPSNGCPSIVESVCFGNVFIEPLRNNGHMRHNIRTAIDAGWNVISVYLKNPVLICVVVKEHADRMVSTLASVYQIPSSSFDPETGYPN
jgi:hypothetical protein